MRRIFGITKASAPWLLMMAFLFIGVIASNNKTINFEGNLKFEADDVKAEVTVFETYSNESIKNDESHGFNHKGQLIFNESQSFESVVLGEGGTINFTSTLNVYTIKVEIKNTFSIGGRNIEVNFERDYLDSICNVKCDEGDGGEFSFENGCWVVSPGKTLILWFEYELDADKSESFDTSEIEDFSLLEIHLKRL